MENAESPAVVKPKCKLIGRDGNVFVIIGNVKAALRKADQGDRATEFVKRALSSESYGAVLNLCSEYVDIK